MNEKLIEKKLREGVKKLGGLALKIYSPWFTGLPDRLVLLPGGRIKWAETKTTGEKLSKRQRYVHELLLKLGFHVWVIDSEETLNEFLQYCEKTGYEV